jgi:hypothetical protein
MNTLDAFESHQATIALNPAFCIIEVATVTVSLNGFTCHGQIFPGADWLFLLSMQSSEWFDTKRICLIHVFCHFKGAVRRQILKGINGPQ